MATKMMKQKIAKKSVASIEELRSACLESGVKLIACKMTVDLFDFNPSDFF
jgi:peroxiredoxin family protein